MTSTGGRTSPRMCSGPLPQFRLVQVPLWGSKGRPKRVLAQRSTEEALK